MPKDYFEAPEVEEEFLTEEEKHVKVIEFVYQVDSSILDSFSWVQIILAVVEIVECRIVCERLIAVIPPFSSSIIGFKCDLIESISGYKEKL